MSKPRKGGHPTPVCGTYNARRRHQRRNETCDTCNKLAPPTPLKPCGTAAAKERHRRKGETCQTCTPKRTLKPCGTTSARARHKKRGETCQTCNNARKRQPTNGTPQPCGTPAAYRRHTKKGQTPCDPCLLAYRAQQTERRRTNGTRPRDNATHLIQEIEFLLQAGEGEARILQATGYTNRVGALKQRLHRHQRHDLITRILNPWDLAA